MPHAKHQNLHTPTGVERACEIAKSLINHARGNYETDSQTVDAVARKARITPAVLRRFLQPSRRPKDVSLSIWQRLVAAYRRHLELELAALQDEIDRLAYLEPDDAAMESLLGKARALCREIEAAAGTVSPKERE